MGEEMPEAVTMEMPGAMASRRAVRWLTLVAIVVAATSAKGAPEAATPARGAPEAATSAKGAPRVADCRQAYEEQEYQRAIDLCARIAGDPTSPKSAVVSAYEVVGMANLVLRRGEGARDAFCALKALAPEHQPTDPIYPSRFVEAYSRAQSACPSRLRLVTEPRARREAVSLGVRLEGSVPVNGRLLVFYRPAGTTAWRRQEAPARERATVALPHASVVKAEVEYYACVVDAESQVVARGGTSDAPSRIPRFVVVPTSQSQKPPPSRPGYWQRTWHWWAIGGVVATTLIVSLSVVGASGGSSPAGSLDTYQLP